MNAPHTCRSSRIAIKTNHPLHSEEPRLSNSGCRKVEMEVLSEIKRTEVSRTVQPAQQQTMFYETVKTEELSSTTEANDQWKGIKLKNLQLTWYNQLIWIHPNHVNIYLWHAVISCIITLLDIDICTHRQTWRFLGRFRNSGLHWFAPYKLSSRWYFQPPPLFVF